MSVVRQRRRICIVNREVGSEDPEPDLKMSQPDEAAFESMSIIVQLKRPTRLQYLPSTDTSFVTFFLIMLSITDIVLLRICALAEISVWLFDNAFCYMGLFVCYQKKRTTCTATAWVAMDITCWH